MAKIKFGLVVTEGSGKLGGHVFSKNRGGAYIRTKVTPLNPQTSYQANVRFLLTTWSKAWSALTQAQILAWNAAVSSFAKTDQFGDLRNPTGKNLYVRLNVNLANAGAASISDPPVPVALSEITGLAVTATAPGTMSVSWTSGAVPAGEAWLLESIKPVNAGRKFVKNLYRVIAVIPAAATSPHAAGIEYTTKFGNLISGQSVAVRVTQISNTTGQAGVPLTAQAIIT